MTETAAVNTVALGPGIHAIPPDEYHADPCAQPSLTSSIARILTADSPLHAWTAHPRLNPHHQNREAAHFDIGTAAHSLLLEGEANVEVIDYPDWRKKDAQEQRDNAYAEGKQPLLTHQWIELEAMVHAAQIQLEKIDADPVIFAAGTAEQTLIWHEGDIICRARLDWLHDDHRAIDDMKTSSRSANPELFSRSLFSMGYDIQAAWYLRGLRAVTGADAEFRFVVLETKPPFALSVVSLAPGALALADEKCEYAIGKWRRCLRDGRWPGYDRRVAYAEAPTWAEAVWLEREAREAEDV